MASRWQNRFPRRRRSSRRRVVLRPQNEARQFGGGLLLGLLFRKDHHFRGSGFGLSSEKYLAVSSHAWRHDRRGVRGAVAQLRRRRLLFGSPSRAQRVGGVARATERAVRSPADRVAQRGHGHEERPARRNLEAELRREVRVRRYDDPGEFRDEAQSGQHRGGKQPAVRPESRPVGKSYFGHPTHRRRLTHWLISHTGRTPKSEMALRITRHAP